MPTLGVVVAAKQSYELLFLIILHLQLQTITSLIFWATVNSSKKHNFEAIEHFLRYFLNNNKL